MAKSWLPLALLGCVGGTFALWYAMDDWERARYFGIIVGLPITVFAIAGILEAIKK